MVCVREIEPDTFLVDDFSPHLVALQGLNVFNTAYVLANPATATDTDYERVEGVSEYHDPLPLSRMRFAVTVAHPLFSFAFSHKLDTSISITGQETVSLVEIGSS